MAKAPKKKQSPLAPWLEKTLKFGVIWVGGAFLCLMLYYAIDLPNIDKPKEIGRRPSLTILDRNGGTLIRLGQTQGQFYTLKDLPPYVPEAVISIEDRRFYHHIGIDPLGILRAGFENLIHHDVVQGGSTITQQLAKNTFLSPEQNLKRKVQEAMLAIMLEMKYSKDEILAAYLNRVYMGSGTYGIDAAAHRYFNKSPSELSLREAATIAGLLRAPNYFSPIASPSRAADRANSVLKAMVEAGYITEKQQHAAETTPPPPGHRPGAGDGIYYAADYVASEVSRLLGNSKQDLIVQTTLDAQTQQAAEQAIADIQPDAQAKHATQAALVAIGPDGGVRALVGGVSYHDSSFNRVTQALRQPGSSFKPLVYLSGLQAGLTPSTVVEDAPITFGDWSPANYDDKYMGKVPLSVALAHSLNSVAIRVLQTAGVGRAVDNAKAFGIQTPMEHNLSLALGTSVLKPIELATAYNTISQLGEYHATFVVRAIANKDGDVLYQNVIDNGSQVARREDVAALTQMMEGTVQFGTGTAANIGRPQAGKTGTTQDFRDAWFAGFVPQLTAVVWMGNDDNSKTSHVTGGTLPAHVWANFMKRAVGNDPMMPLAADDITFTLLPKVEGFLGLTHSDSAAPVDANGNSAQPPGVEGTENSAPANPPAPGGEGVKPVDGVNATTPPTDAMAPATAAGATTPNAAAPADANAMPAANPAPTPNVLRDPSPATPTDAKPADKSLFNHLIDQVTGH